MARFHWLLVPLLMATTCARPAADEVGTAEALAPAAADTLPGRFSRTLIGTAGGDSVEVRIRREGDRLAGTWRGPAGELWLEGTLAAGGAATLEAQTESGSAATVAGTLAPGPEGLELRGEWRAPGEAPRAVALRERRVALGGAVALVSRDRFEADSAGGWTLYAEVPVAVAAPGAELAPAERAFNAAIDSVVAADMAQFRATLSEMEPVPGLDVASFYDSSYRVTLAQNDLASLAFDVTIYLTGAAHPSHATWTLTWDFAAGRPIALGELFLPDADYLVALSDHSIPALERDLGVYADASWIAEGAGPNPDNYRAWSLTPEGLRIVLDPYQVAAYAAGPQVVVVPWSELTPFLAPAGPASRITR